VDFTEAPAGLPKTDMAAHLLVCVGPRCSSRGAREAFDEVWDQMDRERLAYYRTGGSVRLTESGCLGACDLGPTVACYQRRPDELIEQKWFVRMSVARIMELARSVHRPE
jgi:(2Fe-2S) ferredoxin